MKRKSILLGIIASTLFIACKDNGAKVVQPVDDVVNRSGSVRLIGLTFTIVDDSMNERFVPSKLSDSFKNDGMRVLFSGKRGVIPPNVRMIGTPLELSFIQIDIK